MEVPLLGVQTAVVKVSLRGHKTIRAPTPIGVGTFSVVVMTIEFQPEVPGPVLAAFSRLVASRSPASERYLRPVPYQRDAGMTETEARQLASVITEAAVGPVAVEREGHFFVVTVTTTGGIFTIRDDADWHWLRQKLAD